MGDNLNRALQMSLDEYYFLYFRSVRTWFSIINLTYSSIFGKLELVLPSGTSSWSTRGLEFGLGGPTLGGGHILSPGSWMVLPRSWQDSFLYVFFLLCVLAIVYQVVWTPCTIVGLAWLRFRSCMLVGLM